MNPEAAIFSEKIGKIGIVEGTIRMVRSISTEEKEGDIRTLESMINDLSIACASTTSGWNTSCYRILEVQKRKMKKVVTRINFTMAKHIRPRRDYDFSEHNIFYDALHYVFGLDNGAYDQINDLESNQDEIVETL